MKSILKKHWFTVKNRLVNTIIPSGNIHMSMESYRCNCKDGILFFGWLFSDHLIIFYLRDRNHKYHLKYPGGLAQLGEHLPYKQRVSGSSPLTSTFLIYKWLKERWKALSFFYEYTEVNTIMVHEFQGELFKNTGKMVQWFLE